MASRIYFSILYNNTYMWFLLIYYLLLLPICNPYIDALKRKIFDLKYISHKKPVAKTNNFLQVVKMHKYGNNQIELSFKDKSK